MKKLLSLFAVSFGLLAYSQMADNIPTLIPIKINEKSGYIDQSGKTVIVPEYHIAMFFAEDCNLLNSPNTAVRKFGSSDYATVEKNEKSYRIDKKGRRVYEYQQKDLGRCFYEYHAPQYNAYVMDGRYGIISKKNVESKIFDDFVIAPQYQQLSIMDGDPENPMIIAVKGDKFGVINKKNEVIIPFIYDDIKCNLSWKTAGLFEVSLDGNDYFYINRNNHAYTTYTKK